MTGVRFGVQTRLALLSGLAVALALVPVSVLTLSRVHRQLDEEARRAGEMLASQLGEYSVEAVVSGDDLALGRGVATARRQPGVRYAVIYRLDGTVLASSEGLEIGVAIPALLAEEPPLASMGIDPATESDLVDSRKPVALDAGNGAGRILAEVRVGYSFAEQSRRIRSFVGAILLLDFVGLVSGVLLCLYMAQRFADPIVQLTQLAGKVSQGNFDVSTDIRRTDEIGVLAESFNQMTAFLRRGKFLRHAFERYVSPELAAELDRNPQALKAGGGERREVTILFLDIRGFTRMSEKMSAEDVVKFLVSFFNRVTAPIFDTGGAIDKFVGDSMMAVFGFPVTRPDDPLLAVTAALKIQQLIAAYNAQRVEWGLDVIGVGIGINTGMVVAGNVGCDRRLDYTVIGDEVNVASRVCGLATAGQILVTEVTLERLRRRVRARSLGDQTLRGREKVVELFVIEGLADPAERPKP